MMIEPSPDTDTPSSRPSPKGALQQRAFLGRFLRMTAAGLALAGVVAGLLLPALWGDPSQAAAVSVGQDAAGGGGDESSVPRVEVVRPVRGGVPRRTIQPGSVHAFESVDLYAKISGFLKTQGVDIGSVIKRGQVLAEIDAPEIHRDVEEAKALLEQAKARADQAISGVATAEAEHEASVAAVGQSEAEISRLAANRVLSEKQHDRVRDLNARNAVATVLVDEHLRNVEAARAAERAGHAVIRNTQAQAVAARTKVDKARADSAEARAEVNVAEARLARAKVFAGYTTIHAPFDGVVTHRAFHPGAFIRSAAEGGVEPLLTVARTDLMRVVVQVPDRDVPLLDPGDRATISVDALQGRSIHGTVARLSRSEDPTTRTMRAEIDVPNADGLLVEGMYGRVTIDLQPPSDRLVLPANAVTGHKGQGTAAVFVVKDEKARRVAVTLGNDDGTSVEILSGLEPTDQVIVRPSATLDDGASVSVSPAPSTNSNRP